MSFVSFSNSVFGSDGFLQTAFLTNGSSSWENLVNFRGSVLGFRAWANLNEEIGLSGAGITCEGSTNPSSFLKIFFVFLRVY